MPITWRAPATGREYTLPEPDDEPVRRPQARAKAIARMDASPEWERIDDDDGQAPGTGPESPAADVPASPGPESGGTQEAATGPGPQDGGPKPADVRAWAKANDIEVPARGKLPDELVDQYRAAHA